MKMEQKIALLETKIEILRISLGLITGVLKEHEKSFVKVADVLEFHHHTLERHEAFLTKSLDEIVMSADEFFEKYGPKVKQETTKIIKHRPLCQRYRM